MGTGFIQIRVTTMMLLVAGIAINCWLFQYGTLVGLFGLYLTKHVLVAWICYSTNPKIGPRPGPHVPVPAPVIPPPSAS